MKYVDATTYKIISYEEVKDRVEIVKNVPQMVIYQNDLNTDYMLCSDDQFLELCCNVLVIH